DGRVAAGAFLQGGGVEFRGARGQGLPREDLLRVSGDVVPLHGVVLLIGLACRPVGVPSRQRRDRAGVHAGLSRRLLRDYETATEMSRTGVVEHRSFRKRRFKEAQIAFPGHMPGNSATLSESRDFVVKRALTCRYPVVDISINT